MQQELDGRVPLVAVGFSPVEPLAALAAHLELRGQMLADPERLLYRRLGFRRAPLWRVYSPATMLRYAGFAVRGRTLRRPVEDTRQMGGDAIVVDGRAVRVWRPSTPDDRAAPAVVAAAAVAESGRRDARGPGSR